MASQTGLGAAAQGTLFDTDVPQQSRVPAVRGLRRIELARGAWVDVLPGWIQGADEVYSALVGSVPWVEDRVPMYDRVVDVPRLLCFYPEDATLPHPVLDQARDALNTYYEPLLGERLATTGMCLYRNGSDSVAWHGDRHGRSSTMDTHVAIVSFGFARELALRPRGGKIAHRFALGHGDLVVMGGSCQRTWEHAVLKTRRPVGPRISVQFRVRGVR